MVALPANFDNVAAVDFYDQLRALPLSEDLHLDAAQTTRISTLGIQLLVSLENSLSQQGHKLVIENANQDFKETLADIGLTDVMKRWSA
jgi:anti-anti-sigma regulatory factor